jgi:hypothetical protein
MVLKLQMMICIIIPNKKYYILVQGGVTIGMQYIAINELSNFDFHDAELQKIDFNDGNMKLQLSSVNATKQNSQNSFNKDMCIKETEIIFKSFNIEKIVFGAYEVYDSNEVLIESVEAITANPDEYDDILKNSLNDYCYIYSMEELLEIEDRNLVCFNIDGGAGYYYLTLSFSKSIVQWNDYYGKAWYEYEKWKKK